MSVRESAVRGVAWSGIQNWVSSLIAAVVFFVLAHRLSKEAFGLVALASVLIGFLEIFVRMGFTQALVQRAKLEQGHLDSAFWLSVVLGCVLFLGAVLGAPALSSFFGKPDLTPVIRWLSLSFVIAALSNTQAAMLQRDMAFKILATRSILAAAAGGLVGVVMAYLDYGLWSLVGQVLTTRMTATLVLWIGSSWRPGLRVSMVYCRELLSFGAFVTGIELLNFASLRIDVVIMGRFLTAADLGVYDVAWRLLNLMTQVLTQTTAAVALPTFSRIQSDRAQLRHAYLTATTMTVLSAFPAFVGVAVLAPELVHVFFGAEWEASVTPMRVLSLVGMLYAVLYFNQPVLFACGKPSWRLGLAVVHVVTQTAAVWIAVRWGVVAVAAAFVLRTYLIAPLSHACISALIGVRYADYFRAYRGPLVASLFSALLVLLVRETLGSALWLPVRLSVLGLTGVVSYVAVVRWSAPDTVRNAVALCRSCQPGGSGQVPPNVPGDDPR